MRSEKELREDIAKIIDSYDMGAFGAIDLQLMAQEIIDNIKQDFVLYQP